jgi:hypothetical protein
MYDIDHSLIAALREFIRPVVYEVVQEVVREELAKRRPGLDEHKGLLSIKHASAFLDISEKTLRNWIDRGQINRYKIQGCVRVKISELVDLNSGT